MGSLEETREMELYTGADEIQIQVRMRGIMHTDCTMNSYRTSHLVTSADFKSLSL